MPVSASARGHPARGSSASARWPYLLCGRVGLARAPSGRRTRIGCALLAELVDARFCLTPGASGPGVIGNCTVAAPPLWARRPCPGAPGRRARICCALLAELVDASFCLTPGACGLGISSKCAVAAPPLWARGPHPDALGRRARVCCALLPDLVDARSCLTPGASGPGIIGKSVAAPPLWARGPHLGVLGRRTRICCAELLGACSASTQGHPARGSSASARRPHLLCGREDLTRAPLGAGRASAARCWPEWWLPVSASPRGHPARGLSASARWPHLLCGDLPPEASGARNAQRRLWRTAAAGTNAPSAVATMGHCTCTSLCTCTFVNPKP